MTTRCTNCGFVPAAENPPGNNLHELRRRLSSLDAMIALLSAEREKLQAESDAVVYPILSLPTEITTEIFLRCGSDFSLRPDPSKGPLLLAQICHQWREITIHTPEIWRSLYFTDLCQSIELFKLWLDRSGNAPLNLTVHGWRSPQAQSLVAASILHAHHWQDVKFGLPVSSFPTLDLANTSLPLLRSISLDILDQFGDNAVTGVSVVTLINAPLLREAHLHVLPKVKIDLLWSQITTLKLDSMDLTECISLLRECCDLVELTVLTTGEAHPSGSLVLPILEHINCSPDLLEHLTLPHLHRLEITDHVQPHVLSNLSNRSACPLRTLSLSCRAMPAETIIACLAAVPSSVADLEVTAIALPRLLPALNSSDLLPNLKTLRYWRYCGVRPSTADYQDLIDALHVRLQAAAPRVALERFALHLNMYGALLHPRYMPKTTTLAQFRALAAAGLQVKFTMASRSSGAVKHVLFDSWNG
ncbi:hypothetical protein C8R46DRAFT_1185014 [Mycena filopes]|nr:hypothetical protein C8R46DRAFT_1185014 [Mycena filopes]